jgi:serine/threonine-protein kinase
LTGSGLIGTPEYMSPEQAQGQKVGYASDVYALGCLVHEIFLGAPPFHADTPLNTLYMHLHDPPTLFGRGRSLPEPLEPIVRRALAKKPSDRYTASEFADALRHARAALGLSTGDLAAAVAAVLGPGPTQTRKATTAAPATPERGSPPVAEAEATSTLDGRRPRRRWAVLSSRRWRWGLAGLFGVAAAIALVSALRHAEAPEPSDGAPSAVPTVSAGETTPSITAQPSPAPRGAADRAPAGPSRPGTSTPSPRPAALESAASPAPATVIPAPATAAPTVRSPSPAIQGMLSLVIVPPAEVTIDDASVGIVSVLEVPLAPGPHAVRIVHPDYKPLQRKVNIQAGLTERLVLDLSEKAIRRPAAPRE